MDRLHVIDGVRVLECFVDLSDVKALESRICERLYRLSPSMVIVDTPPSKLGESDLVLLETISNVKCPRLCFVNDADFPRRSNVPRHKYDRFTRCLGELTLCAPSVYIAEQVKKEYDTSVNLVYNLFNLEENIQHSDTVQSKFITLINPHPIKGIALFEEVARRMPQLSFLVVRGWPCVPEYITPIPNISVLPFQRDMRSVWMVTRLLLVPSLCEEAFGRVVIEAMLNRIPVIAHGIGGIPEATGGASVLLPAPPLIGGWESPVVSSDDSDQSVLRLCEEIRNVLDNPAWDEDLKNRGVAHATSYINKSERTYAETFGDHWTREQAPPLRVLLISPHSDDIAFSIAGMLAEERIRGEIYFVTIFGKSNYCWGGFQEDEVKITAIRRQEDSHFANMLGLRHDYWEFPEASLRIGSTYDDVMAKSAEYTEDPSTALYSRTVECAMAYRPTHVVLPLGIGLHKDHLVARDLGRIFAKQEGAKCLYYEDLPYAELLDDMSIMRHAKAVLSGHCNSAIVHFNGTLRRKQDLARIYRSQVDDGTLGAIASYANRLVARDGAERVWATDESSFEILIK